MIQKAAYLAQVRGWDYDLLSPLHLALAVPSPQLPATYPMNIFCSIGGKAWGLLIMYEFIVEASRSEAIHEALLRLNQFCAPAELEVWPRPECFFRYTVDLDIEDDVETHLGCAIDEALAQMDMARMVLQLVNWGGKSTDAAIAQVNSSELERLRAAKLARVGNAGSVGMGLIQNDFKIPQDKLDELNASIGRAVSDYFERNPNEDPLDSMSVTFNFVFGYGRALDVHVAGKTISVDLD